MIALAIRSIGLTILTVVTAVESLSDLYFIKTLNGDSGQIEVRVASPDDQYSAVKRQYNSGYGREDGRNGDFTIDNGSLYLVKTRNTGSSTIEIHATTESSAYKTFSLHAKTSISLSDADNGVWTVDGGDLYFIKTRNTGSKYIEVHRVSPQNWGAFTLQVATSIPQSQGHDGTWVMYRGDLYFIKYRNTGGNNVEIHLLSGSQNYGGQPNVYTTWFETRDGDNGTWDIGANGDLYFIKTYSTGSGNAEVHIASSASRYRTVAHYASVFSEGDGPDGVWCVY